MASPSEKMRILELYEIQSSEGPCLDAHRSGRWLVNADRSEAGERWPGFAPRARSAGFQLVHAFPMRLRAGSVGVVNLFDSLGRQLDPGEARLAQALADVATIGILQERAVGEARLLAEQLQRALTTRVVIEQAKGALAERAQVDIAEAFALLRGYARRRNERLGDVARKVVLGELSVEELRPDT